MESGSLQDLEIAFSHLREKAEQIIDSIDRRKLLPETLFSRAISLLDETRGMQAKCLVEVSSAVGRPVGVDTTITKMRELLVQREENEKTSALISGARRVFDNFLRLCSDDKTCADDLAIMQKQIASKTGSALRDLNYE
ncbi:MAG: hypothetical protein LBL83_04170, partial [Clostridiales bacterium]|nr:hypothetical protein [Clostridiales bacterium]